LRFEAGLYIFLGLSLSGTVELLLFRSSDKPTMAEFQGSVCYWYQTYQYKTMTCMPGTSPGPARVPPNPDHTTSTTSCRQVTVRFSRTTVTVLRYGKSLTRNALICCGILFYFKNMFLEILKALRKILLASSGTNIIGGQKRLINIHSEVYTITVTPWGLSRHPSPP